MKRRRKSKEINRTVVLDDVDRKIAAMNISTIAFTFDDLFDVMKGVHLDYKSILET